MTVWFLRLNLIMTIYKNTLVMTLIMALVVPVTALVAVPTAEASCSYQGYSSSHGKCDKSMKWHDSDDDDWDEDEDWDDEEDDDDDWEDNFSKRKHHHQYHFNNNYNSQISELLAMIARLQAILDDKNSGINFGDSEIDLTTISAIEVDDNRAKLRGEIDFNNSDTASVWFEYGKNRNNLTTKTSKIALDDSDSTVFSQTVSGLEDKTLYYFRVVGEDEDGNRDRGLILSFRTSDNSNNTDPEVDTKRAESITKDSAKLNGLVDMNDFSNGNVFFVFGEDKNMVSDVDSDFDSYSEVDEDGDNLQKVLVDSDLDDKDNYTYLADKLDDDTEYFFSICVEYDDDNNDSTIICGDVEEFTTKVN